jgi:hypothetical protein
VLEWRLLHANPAEAAVNHIFELVRRGHPRHVLAGVFIAVAIAAAGCETASTTSTGPTPVKCQVALAAPSMMEAAGGNSSVAVTTEPECAWTATTSASWISGLSPAFGQGAGSVTFRVAANEGTAAREAIITINDEQARVTQRAPCRYTLTPPSQTVATSGGDATVTVSTLDDCSWTATTDVGWISLTSPSSGTGPATIAFTVARNQGSERTGSIVVAGQRANVIQSAVATPSCNSSISPVSQNIGAAGGPGTTISVETGTTCEWAAESRVPWITITSSAPGAGNGSVRFVVAANTGAARTGTIAVANRTFTVNQAAGTATPPACTYSIAPATQNAPAAGAAGTVNVTTTASCTWTASSGAPWLTITAGANGTGNGSVAFTAAANTGALRTGTLTIAGLPFTVTQDAGAVPCTYSIAPTSQNVDANANTGTVTVTAGNGCAWTAVSNALPWLTVTSGASGTGNGPVGFSVAANTGAARTGTVTIAGQTFTVSQAAGVVPCTYSISPTSQNVDANANTGTVTVTAGNGCAWTAVSNAPWLTVTSPASGTGNGSAGFSVAANTGAARTGTLTIAGQTFTVSQAAPAPPPCTYSISPTSQTVPAAGGPATVSVTTTNACTWTATSNAPWITVTSGESGTGNGSVALLVELNAGAPRTGTVTIAGQTFTVTQ